MRDRQAAAFFLIGSICIVAGGLIAAVTTPLQVADGSWLAGYLVLVGGAAQALFGVARAELRLPPLSRPGFWVDLLCWNLGNAAVIAGTLLGLPLLLDAGGVLLVIALVRQFGHLRHAQQGPRWLLWLDVSVTAMLLISIPIGLLLGQMD